MLRFHALLDRIPLARQVAALALAFGISSVGFGAATPFLIIWAHQRTGLSGSSAGGLFVAQALGEICGGLAGGLLADRFGARRIIAISVGGMAAAYAALAVTHVSTLAITLLFVEGLFEAAFHPTVLAIVADRVPDADRVPAYGAMRSASSLGAILGPLAAAGMLLLLPLADVFLFSAGALLVSGAVLMVTLRRCAPTVDLEEEADDVLEAIPGVRAMVRDRRLAALVLAGGLLALTVMWWETDGLVIVRGARSFSTSQFALLLAFSALVTLVGQFPLALATRDHAPSRLLAIGASLQGIGLALIALAPVGMLVLVGAVLLESLGQMLYGPHVNALASRLAPPGSGAAYQAALSTTADVGTILGPLSGLALGAGDPRLLWLVALPICLICAGVAAGAGRVRRPIPVSRASG